MSWNQLDKGDQAARRNSHIQQQWRPDGNYHRSDRNSAMAVTNFNRKQQHPEYTSHPLARNMVNSSGSVQLQTDSVANRRSSSNQLTQSVRQVESDVARRYRQQENPVFNSGVFADNNRQIFGPASLSQNYHQIRTSVGGVAYHQNHHNAGGCSLSPNYGYPVMGGGSTEQDSGSVGSHRESGYHSGESSGGPEQNPLVEAVGVRKCALPISPNVRCRTPSSHGMFFITTELTVHLLLFQTNIFERYCI
jgi:hypothetical protein